jgi:hypothetical protein
MREKAWSMLVVTIHKRLENLHLGMQFVQKWLRKTPYALCKSCRGMLDLQLSYSNLGALQFNFLEKSAVKHGNPKIFPCRNALLRNVARRQAPDRAPAPLAGLRRRGLLPFAGPRAVGPPVPNCLPGPLPLRHAPRTHGWRHADHAAARPLTSPPYRPCTPPYSTLHVAMLTCSLGIASAADKRRAPRVFTRAHTQTAVAPHLLSA